MSSDDAYTELGESPGVPASEMDLALGLKPKADAAHVGEGVDTENPLVEQVLSIVKDKKTTDQTGGGGIKALVQGAHSPKAKKPLVKYRPGPAPKSALNILARVRAAHQGKNMGKNLSNLLKRIRDIHSGTKEEAVHAKRTVINAIKLVKSNRITSFNSL